MRFLLSIAMVLVFTQSALAAKKTASKMNSTKSKVTMDMVKKRLKGFSIVGFWSMADRIPVKTDSGTFKAKSDQAFGFGAEYKASIQSKANPLPLSVVAGLNFETGRELQTAEVNGQTLNLGDGKPGFSLITTYANLSYATKQKFSVFGGLNYVLPQATNFDEVSLSPSVGFQTGVTFELAKNFAADFSHRWINIRGSKQVSQIDLNGFVLQGKYNF